MSHALRLNRTACPRVRAAGFACIFLYAMGANPCIAQDAPDADSRPPDLKALEGRWKMVEATIDGRVQDGAKIEGRTLTFKGVVATDKFGESGSVEYKIRIDPDAKPATMDYESAKGPLAQAIYKLEGDKLTICMRPAGLGRPADFASKPGSQNRLAVYEKVEP